MRRQEIRLDVFGEVVSLPYEVVAELRGAAAARAGISSRHRDLSLVLHRALESGHAVLTRPDVAALGALAEERGGDFGAAADLLRLLAS
jgi:hypothetical protein